MAKPLGTAGEDRAGESAGEIMASRDFKALVSRRWLVSLALLGLLFIVYYGFILLVAGAGELMSRRVGEVMPLAIPAGLGVIVIAFALTAVYVTWANDSYDPEVERLKGRLRR